jgi:SOS-response transcriptional repressor LexA
MSYRALASRVLLLTIFIMLPAGNIIRHQLDLVNRFIHNVGMSGDEADGPETRKPRTGYFACWLAKQLSSRGWTGRELSRRADLSPSTISRWLAGNRLPYPTHLHKLAGALGIPYENVLSKAGYDVGRTRSMERMPVIMVPIVPWTAAASPEEGQVLDWTYTLPRPRAASPEIFAVVVEGSCMEPEIKSGDVAIVNPDLSSRSGDVVLVRVGDQTMVKRVRAVNDEIWLEADNGGPVRIDGEAELIGVIIQIVRDTR